MHYLFIKNSPKSFHNTLTIETRLSDFHKLIVTILKIYLPNNQPKVITYRDCKNFDNSRFPEELPSEIKKFRPLNKNVLQFLKNMPLKNEGILEQIKQIL